MSSTIIYVLCIISFVISPVQALVFKVKDPCHKYRYLVNTRLQLDNAKSLLELTQEILNKQRIPYVVLDGMFSSIQNTLYSGVEDSIQTNLFSAAHLTRDFGWFYTKNRFPLELSPSEVEVTNADYIVWYYGFQDANLVNEKVQYGGRIPGTVLLSKNKEGKLFDWSSEWYIKTICQERNKLNKE